MDNYLSLLLITGLAGMGMTFMPAISKLTGISYAIFYLVLGMIVFALGGEYLPDPSPIVNNELTVHLTELIVIISLMGTGIKIDRRFSFGKWSTPLRLLSIAMLLCIAACTVAGIFLLEVALPTALLLGAVMAPTDPVLAADVQVGPPNEKYKSETRFALTSEAGLNDGLAFPFTWLAIVVAQKGFSAESISSWLAYQLIYKIIVGLIIGWLCGKLVGYIIFTWAKKHKSLQPTDGLLALSLTLSTYALVEMLHGYGFIAVFIAALTLRHEEKTHQYHEELHSFTDQVERLLLGILLILMGGAIVSGILKPLSVEIVLFSCIFLFVIRPVSSYLALWRAKVHWKEKAAIGFFGIRGMGSVYYLAFALGKYAFDDKEQLWCTVIFTVLLSITIHGLSASPVLKHIQKEMPRKPIPD
jgi:NhaP-type Na+/H+ or K+/H+ antiporter